MIYYKFVWERIGDKKQDRILPRHKWYDVKHQHCHIPIPIVMQTFNSPKMHALKLCKKEVPLWYALFRQKKIRGDHVGSVF